MLQRIISTVALIVLVLIIVSAGLVAYRVVTNKSVAGQAPPVPEAQPPGIVIDEGSTADADASGGADKAGAETLAAPSGPEVAAVSGQPLSGEDTKTTILTYALASLPDWDAKILRHDEAWRAVTVRATSPDRKVSLDIELVWDKDLGDYVVTTARAADTSAAPQRAAKASGIPQGIMAAISGHPRLGKLSGSTIEMKKLTSADALVVIRSDAGAWRVYLKHRDGHWVISDARQL